MKAWSDLHVRVRFKGDKLYAGDYLKDLDNPSEEGHWVLNYNEDGDVEKDVCVVDGMKLGDGLANVAWRPVWMAQTPLSENPG